MNKKRILNKSVRETKQKFLFALKLQKATQFRIRWDSSCVTDKKKKESFHVENFSINEPGSKKI